MGTEVNDSLFSGLNLNTYVEPQVFKDGEEVSVRILDAELKTGIGRENGKPWANLQLVLQPINFEGKSDKDDKDMLNPKIIYYPIWLPTPESTVKQINSSKGYIKKVYDMIGEYPADGVPKREDFLGKEMGIVTKLDTTGPEPKNEVRKLVKAA